ncbi:hypothetical protein [Pseudomonas thivervalensis]|uniref:hypothetical protein n=1 Tax=Pseudomonas thivervalensis TaxID=86265 RepID=UPI003D6B30DF
MPYDFPAEFIDIQARLYSLGLMPENLKMIGAFIVAYGLFETTLERAIWTLTETRVEGVRPFTEKMKFDDQYETLSEKGGRFIC